MPSSVTPHLEPPSSPVEMPDDPLLHSLLAMGAARRGLIASLPIVLLWLGIFWSVALP
ncbi:hypothetical protein SIID45300_02593 [Candidatus Magnetaquicoccaceae bacterium FCR-1]|uniref:ABC transporter permease n=1 Tax=Candidatus Magnetaquiglobus chichijimensis TaxID=3141448 RepID=A0ABQ0CBI7_9PROT